MKKSRSEKALFNTIMGFVSEIVTLICGLILPRLILSHFGSTYNGLTSSITQFLSCVSLLTSGVGGVTRAALYKPLAEHDSEKISAIINQTEKFLRKVCLFFIIFVLGFSIIYPIYISAEFEWFFSATLICIISLSTFAQYFFGLTYHSLLEADQKLWICSAVNMAMVVSNCIIDCVLILIGCNIHIVKLGSSLTFVAGQLFLCYFTRKKYQINKKAKSNENFLKDRWNALGHEVAYFVNNNTDVMVLTIFTTLGTVSIYTVYHSIVIAIRKIVMKFINGFGPAFGDMYAKNEIELMKRNLSFFELIVFSTSTIVYSICFIMITPFIMIYTSGINDVNYYQPVFGFIITLAGAFSCFRVPYQTIVTSIGHYKQTRNGSFIEAGLNITISIVLVFKFGLIGIAIGTLVAAIFRTCNFSWYLSKHVLNRSIWIPIKNIIISLGIGGIAYIISLFLVKNVSSYSIWFLYAILIGIIIVTLTFIMDLLFFKNETLDLIRKVISMLKRKRKNA